MKTEAYDSITTGELERFPRRRVSIIVSFRVFSEVISTTFRSPETTEPSHRVAIKPIPSAGATIVEEDGIEGRISFIWAACGSIDHTEYPDKPSE
jgi:hypothetical protein